MGNLPSHKAPVTVEAEHPISIVVTWRVIESRLSKFLWPHIQIDWPVLEASKAFVDVFKFWVDWQGPVLLHKLLPLLLHHKVTLWRLPGMCDPRRVVLAIPVKNQLHALETLNQISKLAIRKVAESGLRQLLR